METPTIDTIIEDLQKDIDAIERGQGWVPKKEVQLDFLHQAIANLREGHLQKAIRFYKDLITLAKKAGTPLESHVVQLERYKTILAFLRARAKEKKCIRKIA